MYGRKKLKVGIYRILILLVILLPSFWYASLPLSGWLAGTLSDYGFAGTGYYIGRGTSVEVLSDDEFARLKELSLLSSEVSSNRERTVFVNFGDIDFSDQKKEAVFTLFENARMEVGPLIGCTPSIIRIRVVKNFSSIHKVGFNGKFIDLPPESLLNPVIVYHEVTRLASYERLFSWNFPASFPLWLDEGLAQYIPSVLGKSPDYRLITREYSKGELSLASLEAISFSGLDPYPASIAVGLIDKLSREPNGLARLMAFLAHGAHFVEALKIVTGLTEVQFSIELEKACNVGNGTKDDSSTLDRSNFIKGKVLYEKACRLVSQRSPGEAIKLLREAINDFDKVAPLAFGSQVAVEKQKARELLAKQMINQNTLDQMTSEDGAVKESNSTERRKSVLATKIIFTQLMVLFVIIGFYVLKLIVLPLFMALFSKGFQSGSVISACVILYLSFRFLKTMTGLVACRLLLFYWGTSSVSLSGLLLLYWWLSGLLMLVYGSLLMESSGGDVRDYNNCTVKAFLSFFCISLLFLVVLNYLGYIKWSLSGKWIGPLIHSVILAMVYAFAHETFFRGGLLKSAETKLHVGSSAALTSLMWAFFITFPEYSAVRLTVAFISGMLFCSLVTTSASISAAAGGAGALHLFDWFILDRGLSPFGHTVFTSINKANHLLFPSLAASFTSLFWVPLVFSGWCLTLIVLKRGSSSRRTNRTSRLFISSEGY
jgi:membrane protease YdiL (CAAX protease family)